MGHPLDGIVHNHGELVGRQIFLAPNDEITDVSGERLFESTLYPVVEAYALRIDAQAHGFRLPHLWVTDATMQPAVTRQCCARTAAEKSVALLQQLQCSGALIRPATALVNRVAVPVQAVRT